MKGWVIGIGIAILIWVVGVSIGLFTLELFFWHHGYILESLP